MLRPGDLVWADFDPVLGTEQAGRRPALIVSEQSYHEVSRRALVCPVSSRIRGWTTTILLPPGLPVTGEVQIDQIRAMDRSSRFHGFIGHVPDDLLAKVRGKLAAILGIPVAAG